MPDKRHGDGIFIPQSCPTKPRRILRCARYNPPVRFIYCYGGGGGAVCSYSNAVRSHGLFVDVAHRPRSNPRKYYISKMTNFNPICFDGVKGLSSVTESGYSTGFHADIIHILELKSIKHHTLV